MKLVLQRVILLDEYKAYAVLDKKAKVVGFVTSKRVEGKKKWAFAYVESQFRQTLNFKYSSKLAAIDALMACRSISTDTEILDVIKSPAYL